MSEDLRSEGGAWLDQWWQILVILFGLLFVTLLVSYSPNDVGSGDGAAAQQKSHPASGHQE